MAKIWITELSELPRMAMADGPVNGQCAQLPPVAEQVVIFTTTTQSAAFNASTRFVRVVADAACHVAVGGNPTATTSTMKLAADSAGYFGVLPGYKIAAVTA